MSLEVFDVTAIICSILCLLWAYSQGKKVKIIKLVSDREDGWLDIKKYPLPLSEHNSQSKHVLATDGKNVKCIYMVYPRYNCKGELILDSLVDHIPITHWMPMPCPPK